MGDFFSKEVTRHGYREITQMSSCLLTYFPIGYQYIHGVNTKTYHLTGEEISMKMKVRKYGDLSYQLTATQQEHPTQDWVS